MSQYHPPIPIHLVRDEQLIGSDAYVLPVCQAPRLRKQSRYWVKDVARATCAECARVVQQQENAA